MALREEQIVRYSRQILLREVGGRGQERLLAAGVRLTATGPAGLTAAAYLAAGGTGVVAGPEPLAPGAAGFLVPAHAVGEPAGPVLARVHGRTSNPDALGARGTGRLAELPAAWEGPGPLGGPGRGGTRGAVVFRSATGCARCFQATAARLGAPPSGALGVGLGALGALVLQRLVLGLGPGLGAAWLGGPGGAHGRAPRALWCLWLSRPRGRCPPSCATWRRATPTRAVACSCARAPRGLAGAAPRQRPCPARTPAMPSPRASGSPSSWKPRPGASTWRRCSTPMWTDRCGLLSTRTATRRRRTASRCCPGCPTGWSRCGPDGPPRRRFSPGTPGDSR